MNNKTHKINVKPNDFISDTFQSIQFAPIPACITDIGGKVLRGNKEFIRMIGPDRGKMISVNLLDFIEFPDNNLNLKNLMNEWREADTDNQYNVNILTKEKSQCLFQLSLARIEKEKEYFFIHYFVPNNNVIELNIKDPDSAFLNLSNLVDDGIYITNNKGEFLFANEEYCRRCNRSLEDLIGRHFLDLYKGEQKQLAQECLISIMGGGISETYKFYDKDQYGQSRYYRSQNVPLKKENKVIGMLGILKDISGPEKVQQELHRYIDIEEKIRKISKLLYESKNVELCLAELGKIFQAKRTAIFQFRENFNKLKGVLEWCDEGVTNLLPEFGDFDSGNLQWWVYKLQNGENIIVEDITSLPAEAIQEKKLLEAAKIKTIVAFPLQIDYVLIGFVVLDMSDVESKLTDFEIQLLRFIADMISLYFYRMQIGEVVQDIEQRYRDLIELTYSAVIIHRDGKILYINQKGAELVGAKDSSEIVGKPIYSFVHPDDSEILNQRFNKDSGNRIFPPVEQKHIKLDGEILYVEVASMEMNYNGKNAYLSVVRDISKRKKIQVALKESEQRYRTLFEGSPEGIILADLDGKILMVNHSSALIFGFSNVEEMLNTSNDSYYYIIPEYKSLVIDKMKEIIDTGEMNSFEINVYAKQKKIITVETHNSLIRDNEGNPSAIISFFHDITLQKRMEDELKKSEERYRLLIDNQIDLVVKVDKKWRFLYVSPSYCDTFGKTEEELLGKHFMPLVHKEDQAGTEEAMKNLYKPPYTCIVEQRAMTKNGWRWLAWIDKAILDENNNVVEIVGLGRDITEQKQFEQQLKASEERFRELAELLPEIVFEIDINGKFTYVNKTAFEITGYSPEDIETGVNVIDLIVPEEKKKAKKNIEKSMKREYVENREYTLIRKDGSTIPVIAKSSPINQNGQVIGLRGIINDISDFKQAEEALRNSEQRFRDIVERSIDGYYFINTRQEVEYMNAAAENIFGTRKDEINIKGLYQSLEYDSNLLESARKNFSKIMGGKTESWNEVKLQNSADQFYWLGYNARRVIENGKVIGMEGFIKDITKQKISEMELRNSEARYRTLFKNIPYEVFNLNSNGHFRDTNMRFIKKWGNLLKKKNLKSPNELLLIETIQQLVDKIKVSGEAVQHEFEMRENNETIFYRLIISPIVPSDNFIIGFVGLNIDITDEVEAIEKTKNFSARLVQIQEDEREHISREIHDNLGQILTALKFELTTAESALNTNIELSHKKLADSHKTLSKAIIEARNLCSSLRPHLLDDFGLDVALKDYLKDFSQKWKFDVDMRIDSISGFLKKDEEISLYRVAQEALNNILKYAKATKVLVELYKQNDKIVLLIKDNGQGFDIQSINNSDQLHLGLIGMRERVEYLNGEFMINSEISKGTEIKAVVPVK